ncbi:MAG: D-alanyl-lipoteichoic acid biosynthesis protein DltD [Chitinophagales bacterium]
MTNRTQWIITALTTIIVLILVDVWVGRYFAGPAPFKSNYRFGYKLTSVDFDRQYKAIKNSPGFRVAVVGDSVIRGAAVPTGESTIPGYLQKRINSDPVLRSRNIRVFNFGIGGAREADKYAVVKKLAENHAADLIIMNVSYPFFSEEINKNPIMFPQVYPNMFSSQERKELRIANITNQTANEAEQDTKVTQVQPTKKTGTENTKGIEGWLTTNLLNHWNLYRYRQEINTYLFGGHPADILLQHMEELLGKPLTKSKQEQAAVSPDELAPAGTVTAPKDRPENMYKPYTEFPWGKAEVEHLQKVFSVKPLNEENIAYRYLDKSLNLIEEKDTPAIVFLSPVNQTLLDKYKALPHSEWRANSKRLQDLCEEHGLDCLDMQNTMQPWYFHDSVHLIDNGNEALANQLFETRRTQLIELTGGS